MTARTLVGETDERTFVEAIARDYARRHLVAPDGTRDGIEYLMIAQPPPSAAVLHNIATRLRRPVRTRVEDAESIARSIDRSYEEDRRAKHRSGADASKSDLGATAIALGESPSLDWRLELADRDLLNLDGKSQVARLVDAILFEALGRKSSDVHIQPRADRCVVRFRIDGMLHDVRDLPPRLSKSVISRVKVMAELDISERRTPQDGRTAVTLGSRSIDVRISTVPTNHGERVVLRLLDHSRELQDLAGLGMPPELSSAFLNGANQAHGFILSTGPTGSGKTTTLYATLKNVATEVRNVMTIEDPIEYDFEKSGLNISQIPVEPRKGVTFATGLRRVLRQDPDVIMVGEIRDTETAHMAIEASQTSHVVFSTLHTNDAPSAVTRLLDLGIEPFLVKASLSAVLAQRLVRLVHQSCGGNGCTECMGTGFLGRTGVFELLVLNDDLRKLITPQSDLVEIRGAARQAGMRTLLEEGARLVQEGRTTQAEIDRVLLGTM